jgi:hypothetical protein
MGAFASVIRIFHGDSRFAEVDGDFGRAEMLASAHPFCHSLQGPVRRGLKGVRCYPEHSPGRPVVGLEILFPVSEAAPC